MERLGLKIEVSGRVQGVFFRKYTYAKAIELQIDGYVRNLPNGKVEIVAVGSDTALRELLDWCKSGSPQAQVESVESAETEVADYSGFHIRY